MGSVNDEEEGMLNWCGNDDDDEVARCDSTHLQLVVVTNIVLLTTASSSDINTVGTIHVSRLETIHYA